MRAMGLGAVFTAMASLAAAEETGILQIPAAASVTETIDSLVSAMEGAGLTIFARIDHGAGAMSIGEDIGASQLLVFGNPNVGTPAMQDDPLAGLFLPLKVLVYEDADGQAVIAYEDPAAMLTRLDGIGPEAGYIERMTGALANFTGAVAQ